MAFVTKMHDKHRYASPSAVQAKNWRKTCSIEDTLHELNVGVCHNFRFAYTSVCTICDNADRIM